MSTTSAVLAGTLVGGAALAGVAWEMDKNRRAKRVQEELEKLIAQRQQREDRRDAVQQEPKFLEFGKHLSTVFGTKLQKLQDMLERLPSTFQLPVLGADNADFVVVAVILLFGHPLFQQYWPHALETQFGMSVYALSHDSADTGRCWLAELAGQSSLHGFSFFPRREEAEQIAILSLTQVPFFCQMQVKDKIRRNKLADMCRKLGLTCNIGGGVVATKTNNAFEFHSQIDRSRYERDATMLWIFNFSLPVAWHRKTGDEGFLLQEMEGGVAAVGCTVTEPSRQQREARFQLAAEVFLRLEATEVLKRLDQLRDASGKRTGASGLTLEWCAAISGTLSCDLNVLQESLAYDLHVLQLDELPKMIVKALKTVVPMSAEQDAASHMKEISHFVEMFVEYLKGSLVITKRFDVAEGPGKISRAHPHDLAAVRKESAFNVSASALGLQFEATPVLLHEVLLSLQEAREAAHGELERAPRWWSCGLGAIIVSLMALLIYLVANMMFAQPSFAAAVLAVQMTIADSWLASLTSHSTRRRSWGITISVILCLGLITRLLAAFWPGACLISLASVFRSLFNLRHYMPANVPVASYQTAAKRFGWEMPIQSKVATLEGCCREQLRIWHMRLAAQHLRAHVARGCISAIQGERFLQALLDLDGSEHCLPGTCEEAESFLALEVVSGSMPHPSLDLKEDALELTETVAGCIEDSLLSAPYCFYLEDESDAESPRSLTLEDGDDEADGAPEPVGEPASLSFRHQALPDRSGKPKRRESNLEYELRQRGWQFTRRSKRIIVKRVREGSDKENVSQAFSMAACPKDRRNQQSQLCRLRRMDDEGRDFFSRKKNKKK